MRTERLDIHQAITDNIIAAIEAGAGEFRLPWQRSGLATVLPTNSATGNAYQGINILSLWASAIERNYPHARWATYRQWAGLGAQVRKGEKASLVVFYKQFDVEPNPEDESDDGCRRVARASRLFNIAQVDNYAVEPFPDMPPLEREARTEAFVAATAVDIRHGGDHAFYRLSSDHVQMPDIERFTAETRVSDYYSVLLHELTHASAHPERCDRQLGKRFGDDAYCVEELVAELGAAFLCAELGISSTPRADHASYIAHWLHVLKADNRAIFSAAARASEAVRYFQSLQPEA